MIHITKMVQTCGACPSQWDGWDADGTYYYFRYRHGSLTVEAQATTILAKSIGDGLDGVMSYDALRTHVASRMVLPENDT